MNDLIVAELHQETFRVKIGHGERDVVVVPLAVDRIFFQILQRIVHPSQVPLIVKAQTAVKGALGHIREIGGIFCDQHDLSLITLIQQKIHALDEVERSLVDPQLFVAMPEDRIGDRIHAQTVKVIDIDPERCGRHQEGSHFLFPQVEVGRSPLAVCIVCLRIFIQRRSVKIGKREIVLYKMHRNKIHDDADPGLVCLIDQIHQVMAAAIAAGDREITGALIAPGTIKRILAQRHQLDVCKMILLDIADQLFGDLAIVDKLLFLFLHPRTNVHLIDIDRTVKAFVSVCQPFLIAPAIPRKIFDHTGRIRAQFTVKGIWIHLIHHTAGCLCDPIFIGIMDLCAFDVDAPCSAFIDLAHLMSLAGPVIKRTDDLNGLCIRCIDRKAYAFFLRVCSIKTIGFQ